MASLWTWERWLLMSQSSPAENVITMFSHSWPHMCELWAGLGIIYHLATWRGSGFALIGYHRIPSCRHLKRSCALIKRSIVMLKHVRMRLAFALIYPISISGQATYSAIMESCRYRRYILTCGGIFTADQKRHEFFPLKISHYTPPHAFPSFF